VRVIQPSRFRTVAAVAVLMLVPFVACGEDKKEAPTTTAPEGFSVVQDAEEGFAIAVPSTWTLIPLAENPANFDKAANQLRRENPKLASILNQARVLGQSGGKFMAVSADATQSVNLTADKAKEKTVEEIVTASIEGLKSFDAANFAQEPATLSGLPAIRLTFRLPVDTDNGPVQTDEVQHYLLRKKTAYILTVAGAPGPVSSAIATSFKLR
jgi:hypothetical protein